MALTKTVTKSKKDGVKKRTVTKSNKRGTTTKSSVRSGGKILSKSSEKRKGIRAPGKTEKVTIKNKRADGLKTKRVLKVKSTKSGKGTVYTDTKTTKKPSTKKSIIKTKELSGTKSKGNETYVTQKRKNRRGEKKAKLGHYVGSGTSGKRRTYSKVKK